MHTIENDPLDRHIDIKSKKIIKNPFCDMFTAKEKLQIMLDAFLAETQISKEDFKKSLNAYICAN